MPVRAGKRERHSRRYPLTILLAACTVAASACGGGVEEPANQPEDGTPPTVTADTEQGGGAQAERTGDPGRGVKDGESPKPGSGDDAQSPDKAIRRAVEGFLSSTDPAVVCAETVTMGFLREGFGDRNGCLDAQTSGSAADSVEITGIDAQARSARVVAVPAGGPNDGERLKIDLVRDGPTWRIDGIRSNVPVGP